MKLKEIILVSLFLILITFVFFYKTFFAGFVPIPGDLLISEYSPWKAYSYLGYNPGSFPNKAQYFDVLRQLYPWKTLAIGLLKTGEFPLWNPFSFSGAPLLANFQSAVFYPLNLVYFVLPQISAWTILILLQPLLTALFMYLFTRKIGVSHMGSLFAAVSFTFSSFMTVWLEYNTLGHVILWLPLIFLSFENLLEKYTAKWILVFVFSLVFSLFAGHPQVFMYLIIFVFIYIIYRIAKKQRLLFFSLLLFLSLGIGAIQLVPGIELIVNSARSSHSYDFLIHKILIQPWQLIMLFVPDFFGNPATRNYYLQDTYVGKVTSIGLIPLFFITLLFFRKKEGLTKFFLATAVSILILTTLNPFSQLLYKLKIPLILANSPTLAIFIFCFSLSVLCGFGVDIWRKTTITLQGFIHWILPIVTVFIFLWIVVLLLPKVTFTPNLSTSFHNLTYSTAVLCMAIFLLLVGTLKTKRRYLILILLFLLTTSDLWRSFEKFNPFSPPQFVFPKTKIFGFLKKESGINRFWGYGSGTIQANFATEYALFSPDGYDPLYPRRYGEFIQSSTNGKINTDFTTQTRSDAVIAPGFGKEDLPSNPYRLKVLDLLGIKYVLDRVENGSTEITFPKDRFLPIYQKDGWSVFENLKASPRAFLTSDYKVFKNKEEFERRFFAKEFNPSKTILLEEDPPNLDYSNNQKLTLISYTPNRVVFQAKTGKTLLFLSDVYYPGWKAFVDGESSNIYRADYAFRAIYLPKGEHKVLFTFDPSSFKIGLAITGVTLFAFLISLPLGLLKKLY